MSELALGVCPQPFPQGGAPVQRVRAQRSNGPGGSAAHEDRALARERRSCDVFRRENELLEAEIARIAHALHDEAGQLLTAVHLKLSALASNSPQSCLPAVDEIRTLLDRVELQLRQFSHELRPTVLDDLGLAPALRFLIRGFAERTGLRIGFHTDLERRFPAEVETAIYRSVQESLTNVGRHAHASQAWVELLADGGVLQCLIQDDGAGFDVAACGEGGLGLRGMRARAEALGGCVRITSGPGRGTEVAVILPLE